MGHDCGAGLDVLRPAAHVLTGPCRDGDPHPRTAPVGVRPGHDGVGPLRQGGAGVDQNGGAGNQPSGAHITGAHGVHHVQGDRGARGGAPGLSGDDRIAVHAGQVDNRQVELGDNVLGQDTANGVGQENI